MAITYPISLPTVSGIATVTMTAKNTVGLSQSPFTMKQQVQKHAGQRWEAQITMPPMTRADAEEWVSFLMKMNGVFGTFLLGDPNGKVPRGNVTSYPADTLLVNGASQTGNSLDLDGGTADVTDYVKAGDYIQIGSGAAAQLYKVLNDADTNASGEITLDIWPNLRTSPADGTPIIGTNTVGNFRLATNTVDFNIDQASFYGISFQAIEAL